MLHNAIPILGCTETFSVSNSPTYPKMKQATMFLNYKKKI